MGRRTGVTSVAAPDFADDLLRAEPNRLTPAGGPARDPLVWQLLSARRNRYFRFAPLRASGIRLVTVVLGRRLAADLGRNRPVNASRTTVVNRFGLAFLFCRAMGLIYPIRGGFETPFRDICLVCPADAHRGGGPECSGDLS